MRQWRWLLSLLVCRRARLRSHRAGRRVRAGLPAHRRGAALRHHSAAEQDQAQQGDHPMSADSSTVAAVVAPTRLESLAAAVARALPDQVHRVPSSCGELTCEVAAERLLEVAMVLRDARELKFEMCMDVCG